MAGFLILQPRRHVEHIAEFTVEESMNFGPLLKKTSMALMNVCEPQKVYVCSFGSLVKHVHFYLIPQRTGMPNATALLDELAAGKYACTDEQAAEGCCKGSGGDDEARSSALIAAFDCSPARCSVIFCS